MLGKIQDRRRGWQRMRWLDDITQWTHTHSHWLNGHEFEQTPGDREGQGSLVCCSPWGCKEPDMTERLNNNNKIASCKAITNWETSWLPGVCSPYCNCREKSTFLFWLCLTACRILLLVPRPGIDPEGEVRSSTLWSARGVPRVRPTCSVIGVLLWSLAGGQPHHPSSHHPHQCR